MEANKRQVGGNHYQSGFQHWDWALELKLTGLPWQVTRYLTRWRKKDGVEGLEKAIHCLDKWVEHHNQEKFIFEKLTESFISANHLTENESQVLKRVLSYLAGNEEHLFHAKYIIQKMLKDEKLKNKLEGKIEDPVSLDPEFIDNGDEWRR